MIDHDRFIQLIAGRELGELDDAESAELDRHLAGCVDCAAEAGRLAEAAAELALAAPIRQPPAGMRPAILAAIRDQARAELATGPIREPSAARPAGGWLAWLRGSQLRLTTAGLAGVLVVASLGIGARLSDLQARLEAQERVAGAAQVRLAVQGAAMAVVLDPRHVAAALEPEPVAPSAIAEVVYRPGSGQAYLIADHLPATPTGHVYQLWYADGTGVHPLSTFAFDGTGAFVAPFGVDLGGKAATMVTLEPTGGSTGSPGPQVVFGELPQG